MRPPLPCMCGHREVAHEHHRARLDRLGETGWLVSTTSKPRGSRYAHFVTKPLSGHARLRSRSRVRSALGDREEAGVRYRRWRFRETSVVDAAF